MPYALRYHLRCTYIVHNFPATVYTINGRLIKLTVVLIRILLVLVLSSYSHNIKKRLIRNQANNRFVFHTIVTNDNADVSTTVLVITLALLLISSQSKYSTYFSLGLYG